MMSRVPGLLLCAALAAGCAAFQVRHGVLEGNVLYTSMMPELQVRVAEGLRPAGRETLTVEVAIENRPTTLEFTRSDRFRFQAPDGRSGVIVTVTQAPMDMLIVPGFRPELLGESLDYGTYRAEGRSVHHAVLPAGEYLFDRFRVLSQSGRKSLTIDYWERLGDRGPAAADRRRLTDAQRASIAEFHGRATAAFGFVVASPGAGQVLVPPPAGAPGTPAALPEPPFERPMAAPASEPIDFRE